MAHLLAVLADPNADPIRQDRVAIALLPFCHGRIADVGKKERLEELSRDAAAGTEWAALLGERAPAPPPDRPERTQTWDELLQHPFKHQAKNGLMRDTAVE
jgi:hypothetical protein